MRTRRRSMAVPTLRRMCECGMLRTGDALSLARMPAKARSVKPPHGLICGDGSVNDGRGTFFPSAGLWAESEWRRCGGHAVEVPGEDYEALVLINGTPYSVLADQFRQTHSGSATPTPIATPVSTQEKDDVSVKSPVEMEEKVVEVVEEKGDPSVEEKMEEKEENVAVEASQTSVMIDESSEDKTEEKDTTIEDEGEMELDKTAVSVPFQSLQSLDIEFINKAIDLKEEEMQPKAKRMRMTPMEGIGFDDTASTQYPVITTSNLQPQEEAAVREAVLAVGGVFTDVFQPEVTHVIVSTVEGRLVTPYRTSKYFHGILEGKWVMPLQWVNESMAQRRWLNENRFEVLGDTQFAVGGPRSARLLRGMEAPKLFHGLTFIISSEHPGPLAKNLRDLIMTGGGFVATLPTDIPPKGKTIFLCPKEGTSQSSHPNSVSIVYEWLLDCISCYNVVDYTPYLNS